MNYTSPTRHVPANIHVEHTQLRDLISCPDDSGDVVFASTSGLSARNVRLNDQVRCYFHITCPTASLNDPEVRENCPQCLLCTDVRRHWVRNSISPHEFSACLGLGPVLTLVLLEHAAQASLQQEGYMQSSSFARFLSSLALRLSSKLLRPQRTGRRLSGSMALSTML